MLKVLIIWHGRIPSLGCFSEVKALRCPEEPLRSPRVLRLNRVPEAA